MGLFCGNHCFRSLCDYVGNDFLGATLVADLLSITILCVPFSGSHLCRLDLDATQARLTDVDCTAYWATLLGVGVTEVVAPSARPEIAQGEALGIDGQCWVE